MTRQKASRSSPNQPTLFDDSELFRKTAPCVHRLKNAVDIWRKEEYPGATTTTRRLLKWWFDRPHRLPNEGSFHYYRAQVEHLPLAACSQDIENGVGTLPIGHAWSPTAKTMGVDRGEKERL